MLTKRFDFVTIIIGGIQYDISIVLHSIFETITNFRDYNFSESTKLIILEYYLIKIIKRVQ